jgi:hypothetical protein
MYDLNFWGHCFETHCERCSKGMFVTALSENYIELVEQDIRCSKNHEAGVLNVLKTFR